MRYYIIDAFAEEVFQGNPAGVCLLEKALSPNQMQQIAAENNLAETAFLLQKEDSFHLRWFTPEVEMDLCGHAALATAYVMLEEIFPECKNISFETKSGTPQVTKERD